MPAHITFQGRSYHNPSETMPVELHFLVEGVDLDYGPLTVYMLNDDSGDNMQLAQPFTKYVNEDGNECPAAIAWEIKPDPKLLELWPRLKDYIGLVYGRPIITSGDMAVDRWNEERPTFTLDLDEPERMTVDMALDHLKDSLRISGPSIPSDTRNAIATVVEELESR